MGRPRSRPTLGVQEADVTVQWVWAEPTPLQRLAWQRLWNLLLRNDPTTPAPDELPPDVPNAGGTRTHAHD
jgi:hypothetical protein